MKSLACPNEQCLLFRNPSAGNIIKYGFYQTRWGKRRRYRCLTCGKTTGFIATELQADEIRTIVGGKEQPIWIFAVIEVWPRLWLSTVVGRQSYRNTLTLFQDVSSRINLEHLSLITTDGFEFYERDIGQVFGPACLYGQVIKIRRNDRYGVKSRLDF